MSVEGPLSNQFLATVSTGPGVYQMLGEKEVLYVGKAVNLRKRLASYRRFLDNKHAKTGVMLSKVQGIETILTTTEKEALILEASLIKKNRPRYNVILRDDKNYPLIKVTVKEEWPRITVTRKRSRDGNRYFGPYASITAMRNTLKLLRNLFPLRRCRKVKPRDRPCLDFQLGQCLAPCTKNVNKEKYTSMVRGVIMILEGRNRELLKELPKKMKQASKSLDFEEAALIRDQIQGLKRTLENQVIAAEHIRDQDVFGLARQDISVGIAILFIRSGLISGAQTFFLHDPIGSNEAILAQTIHQYYSSRHHPPSELLLPLQPDDAILLQEHLTDLHDSPVKITVPQRGKRMQLMDMAYINARQLFAEKDRKSKSWKVLATALLKTLHLNNEPVVIECVDISNISGKQAVGSLVSFKKGTQYSKGYRHYRIMVKTEPDDYAMMREVLRRRLTRGIKEENLPNLLLLDGGKGQLNLAVAVLKELDLIDQVELASIAKDKKNKGERIFRPGRKNPVGLPRHSPVLLFLMRIRDEAHRFGITHHRKLRRQEALGSKLDGLRGIGTKRKLLLLKTFGSFKRIEKAFQTDFEKIPGIGTALAASIYQQLHEHDKT